MLNPPRSFVKDLKNICKHLDCEFEPRYERFIVTYKRAIGEPVPVFVVETDDKQFRYPDQRDIKKVVECDLERETVDEKMQRISKQVWDAQREQQKKASQEWRERTLDDKLQLASRFAKLAGFGKGNSTFRRIDVKPKGKVFK